MVIAFIFFACIRIILGYWWIERSWPYDNVSDQTQLTTELTEAMLGVWDYIKNSGEFPNVENLALDWFGECKPGFGLVW